MSKKYELMLLAFIWVVFFAFINAPGRIEGKYFPIVANFQYSIDSVEDDYTNLFISFDKLRNECSFRNIELYMIEGAGDDTQEIKLHAIFAGQEQARWRGHHEAVGPWQIRATPEQLQNVVIKVEHRCHAGFLTISHWRVTDGQLERI